MNSGKSFLISASVCFSSQSRSVNMCHRVCLVIPRSLLPEHLSSIFFSTLLRIHRNSVLTLLCICLLAYRFVIVSLFLCISIQDYSKTFTCTLYLIKCSNSFNYFYDITFVLVAIADVDVS